MGGCCRRITDVPPLVVYIDETYTKAQLKTVITTDERGKETREEFMFMNRAALAFLLGVATVDIEVDDKEHYRHKHVIIKSQKHVNGAVVKQEYIIPNRISPRVAKTEVKQDEEISRVGEPSVAEPMEMKLRPRSISSSVSVLDVAPYVNNGRLSNHNGMSDTEKYLSNNLFNGSQPHASIRNMSDVGKSHLSNRNDMSDTGEYLVNPHDMSDIGETHLSNRNMPDIGESHLSNQNNIAVIGESHLSNGMGSDTHNLYLANLNDGLDTHDLAFSSNKEVRIITSPSSSMSPMSVKEADYDSPMSNTTLDAVEMQNVSPSGYRQSSSSEFDIVLDENSPQNKGTPPPTFMTKYNSPSSRWAKFKMNWKRASPVASMSASKTIEMQDVAPGEE